MYAIPAETVSQNMPFEKENLPGPGKQALEHSVSCVLTFIFCFCYTAADHTNMANFYFTEALQTQTGERDGQQLFVRENDSSVTAHLWSSARGQWDLVY
jgi:phospholipase A-2-activating protein